MTSGQSMGNILLGPENVCPGETEEYEIDSSVGSGEQQFGITNGKFIVADSLYQIAPWATTIDSTFIIMNVDDIDEIEIQWGNESGQATVYWYELNEPATTQNFNIYSSDFSRLIEADTIVLNGANFFKIVIRDYDADDNNTIHTQSSNIISVNNTDIDPIPWSDIADYEYTCEIEGDQVGWINFITSGPASSNCPSISNNIIQVNIHRKLNPPTIAGNSIICNNQSYSITGDAATETYTWTVTNGLKIYKNNQYLTSYTGTESSVPIYKPANSRGNGDIKVKASASGYTDSDEMIKQVWFGPPAVYSFGNHLVNINTGMPIYQICFGTHNECEAVHPAGNAHIDDWEWQVTNATIYPYGYLNQYATIYPDNSSFGIEIRAHNQCGWSEWSRMIVQAINCYGYYMTISPNPADSYIELNFIEEKDIENNNNNKLKIKKGEKSKDGEMEEYLVKILDKNGNNRKSTQTNSRNVKIETDDLEAGTYYLHLTIGGETYKQQLIIY